MKKDGFNMKYLAIILVSFVFSGSTIDLNILQGIGYGCPDPEITDSKLELSMDILECIRIGWSGGLITGVNIGIMSDVISGHSNPTHKFLNNFFIYAGYGATPFVGINYNLLTRETRWENIHLNLSTSIEYELTDNQDTTIFALLGFKFKF